MAFFLRGGCGVHCVGRRAGLAPRIVPSVEQADSAIFCSRVSHILHRVHSRRRAHTQMDPEHQQRAALPLEMQPFFFFFFFFLVLGVSLERAKLSGGLSGPHSTPQMGREPGSRVSGMVMHVQRHSRGNEGASHSLEGAIALLPKQ